MLPQQWERIKEIYYAAADMDPGTREGYLEKECATEPPEVRASVERLLRSPEPPAEFLNEPPLDRTPAPRRLQLRSGSLLTHYKIGRPLGAGGMGLVYAAVDTRLNRAVAIKVLQAGHLATASERRRFVHEAEAASSLNHPNIVTIYEIGREHDVDFIAMEHIAGKTLASLIRPHRLDLTACLRCAIQIADALATAHDAGIVHRDLKPSNVMVTDKGLVKILDFGLAKSLHPAVASGASTVTAKGTVMGTFAYMSPEQIEGKHVDNRSDIFALGCVLYEMLTGQQAFKGTTNVSVLSAVLEKEPTPVRQLSPDVPRDIARAVAQCLRKDPLSRWQHMADLRIHLAEILREIESGERAEDVPPPKPAWRKFLRGALGGAAATLAVLLLWIAFREPSPGPEPVLTRLTTDSGLSAYPSLSKDGALLAYASDRGGEGNLDIWLQQIGGGRSIRLTDDPGDELDPSLSPDGTRVAFRSEKDGGGIYIVAALGGEPRLIARGGRNPRFSPDGRWIAYWEGEEGGFLTGSGKLYLTSPDGGQPRRLRPDFAAASYPIWSPGGERLLFVGRNRADKPITETLDWWITPLDAGSANKTGVVDSLRRQSLSFPLSYYTFHPETWLDDNSVVVAASLGEATNLWKVSLRSGSFQIAVPARRLTSGTGAELHAAFAAHGEDSSRAVFSSLQLDFDIWSLPIEADTGRLRGQIQRLTEDVSFDAYPSLSLDGLRLAFASELGGAQIIRVRDLSTGAERTLLSMPPPAGSKTSGLQPKISGDGNTVVYVPVGDKPGLFSIDARGGVATKLCDRCGNPTSISRDGRQVLFEPIEPPDDIMALDAATGHISRFVPAGNPQHFLFGGSLSPDGNWVAFHARLDNSRNRKVFVASVKGGRTPQPVDWIPLTDGQSPERMAEWSPGGNLLYFLSERDGFRCIWARALEPSSKQPQGEAFPVQHFHHARYSLQRFGNVGEAIGMSVAPGKLVFAMGELTGNLWLRDVKK